jgi:ankyrin repeat protein
VLKFLDYNVTIEKIKIDGILDTLTVSKKISSRTSSLSSSPKSAFHEPKDSSLRQSRSGAGNYSFVQCFVIVTYEIKKEPANVETKLASYETALVFLLKNNPSLVLIGSGGETLAHHACSTSNLSLLKILYANERLNSIIDIEDSEGRTPLSIALTSYNAELINCLFTYGARNIGSFSLLELLKEARADSLEWTIAMSKLYCDI